MRSINLAVLRLFQLVSVSGSVLVVTVGGLVGMELATDPRIATLPLSIMIVGTALSTVAAALLMQRYGRRLGFAFGALLAAAGALLAAGGLEAKSFVVFCVGIACIGIQNAFVQQYRFAAAESVAVRHAGRAISLILLGAIGGGFFGPVLATVRMRSPADSSRSPRCTVLPPYCLAACAGSVNQPKTEPRAPVVASPRSPPNHTSSRP